MMSAASALISGCSPRSAAIFAISTADRWWGTIMSMNCWSNVVIVDTSSKFVVGFLQTARSVRLSSWALLLCPREPESLEQEGVHRDEEARSRHRQRRDLRPKDQAEGGLEDSRGDRDRHRVVADRPPEVLPLLAEGPAADREGGGGVQRIGAHENDVS